MYNNFAISLSEFNSLWLNTDTVCRYGAFVLKGNCAVALILVGRA